MFRFPRTLDIITLFHNPTIPSSVKALTLLNRASALAQAQNIKPGPQDLHTHQTQRTNGNAGTKNSDSDSGSDNDIDSDVPRIIHPPGAVFELEVTMVPPTSDQLGNILDYLGSGGWRVAGKPADIVAGAADREDAIRKVRLEGGRMIRPLIVDWNNAKAVYGYNSSAILKMLEELPPR